MESVTIRQCAVLVGGHGPPNEAAPAPLSMVGDRSLLAWLLRELCRFGVTEFVLLCGPSSDAVERVLPAIRAKLPRPVTISVSREPAGAGTGGALLHATEQLHERFLFCNGGSLFDTNLASLLAAAADDGPEVVGRLLLTQLPDASRSAAVAMDGDRVVSLRQPPQDGTPGLIDAGVYLFRRSLLDELRPVCSLEADILPRLAAAGALRGTANKGLFRDAGADDERLGLGGRRALVLDRDGVINVDHGHIGSRERFDWTPGALETIRYATEAGWHVFVVTNQSGVARRLYDEAAVRDLLDWMADEARRHGGTIDDARYCPFHPDATVAAYRAASDWRKPAPGMLLDLIRAWELDPARAVLIGDQATDLAAGVRAGIKGFLFRGGNLLSFVRPLLEAMN